MRESGYIIIEGNIGVGKSTFAEILVEQIKAHGFKAECLREPADGTNPYLSDYYESPERYAFEMQTYLLSRRYEMTQKAAHGAMSGDGWFIMDRSYFGDLCFANVQKRDGFFDDRAYKTYVNLHNSMKMSIPMPTCAIFLNASIDTCKKRIDKRLSERSGRQCESGISLHYLTELQEEINKMEIFIKTRCRTCRIDWNDDLTLSQIRKEACNLVSDFVIQSDSETSIFDPWGNASQELFFMRQNKRIHE